MKPHRAENGVPYILVEWALVTHFQGLWLAPSTDDGVSTRVGFDCTVPLRADEERPLRIAISGSDAIRTMDDVVPLARTVFA